MRISGFSFGKNTQKLYYPVRESVASMLPLVDEVVFALGKSDPDDRTRELLESLNSPKLKIVDTVWDTESYPDGMENAHQTDIAKSHCSGDWLMYLQADEVIHEDSIPVIRQRCEELRDHPEVEGLLFPYFHFWGDYDHYQVAHGWYKHEIRLIRNHPDIHSWQSAQSFRRIPNFDEKSYRQKEGTHKLRVARVNAPIFHYGWVRPPALMRSKSRALDAIHKGQARADAMHADKPPFDYGPLDRLPVFKGSHPAVMKDFMARFNWKDQLQYSGNPRPDRPPHRHEKTGNRLHTWLEQRLLGGKEIGGFRNYVLVDV